MKRQLWTRVVTLPPIVRLAHDSVGEKGCDDGEEGKEIHFGFGEVQVLWKLFEVEFVWASSVESGFSDLGWKWNWERRSTDLSNANISSWKYSNCP